VGTSSSQVGGAQATGGASPANSGPLIATTISAGSFHTCAVLKGGSIKCWGGGGLGNGTYTGSTVPVTVEGITNATMVSTGGGANCARLNNGDVQCWGDNSYGELGNNLNFTGSSSPVLVTSIALLDSVVVTTGGAHTCSLASDGWVDCWGDNSDGQYGNEGTLSGYSAQSVSNVSTAVDVEAGGYHTCALLKDGAIQCWGEGSSGELGTDSPPRPSVPVSIVGMTSVVSVTAGTGNTCAVLTNGSVHCWGDNSSGQLGDGTTTNSSKPVAVTGITNASAVSADGNFLYSHACALSKDGSVRCWGSNHWGQLGDGSTTDSPVPVAVSGITDATAVSVGQWHTCALLSGGSIRCWGDNSEGALGNGTTTGSSLPVTVNGF
jgi:alpha-tubulin suppressor-like RCC1 family protein